MCKNSCTPRELFVHWVEQIEKALAFQYLPDNLSAAVLVEQLSLKLQTLYLELLISVLSFIPSIKSPSRRCDKLIPKLENKVFPAFFSTKSTQCVHSIGTPQGMAVSIQWTGPLDWNTGPDYWTHLWPITPTWAFLEWWPLYCQKKCFKNDGLAEVLSRISTYSIS